MRPILRGLVGLAVFFGSWEAAVRLGMVDPQFLPPPSLTFLRLGELLLDGPFILSVVATVLAWLIALGLAVVIAVPAGLLLGTLPAARSVTRTLIELVRPIPPVALIPLVIILVGQGPETKIMLAVYAAVWPLLFNTIYALDEIDPMLVDCARSFGCGRGRVIATVALPHALPFVFTAFRLSAAIALIVIISTEYLAGGGRGLGIVILQAAEGAGRMDLVLAGTLVAGVIGFVINDGLERIGRRWFAWNDTAAAGTS